VPFWATLKTKASMQRRLRAVTRGVFGSFGTPEAIPYSGGSTHNHSYRDTETYNRLQHG